MAPRPPDAGPAALLPTAAALAAALRALTACACGRVDAPRLFCRACRAASCAACRCCARAAPEQVSSDVAAAAAKLAAAARPDPDAGHGPGPVHATLRVAPPVRLRLRLRAPPHGAAAAAAVRMRMHTAEKGAEREEVRHKVAGKHADSDSDDDDDDVCILPVGMPAVAIEAPLASTPITADRRRPSSRASPVPNRNPPPPAPASPPPRPPRSADAPPPDTPSTVRKSGRRRRPSSRARAVAPTLLTPPPLLASPSGRDGGVAPPSTGATTPSAGTSALPPRIPTASTAGAATLPSGASSPLLPPLRTTSSPAALSPARRGARHDIAAAAAVDTSVAVHPSTCPPDLPVPSASHPASPSASALASPRRGVPPVRTPPSASPRPAKRRRTSPPDMHLSGSRQRRVCAKKRPRSSGSHESSKSGQGSPVAPSSPSCAALPSSASLQPDLHDPRGSLASSRSTPRTSGRQTDKRTSSPASVKPDSASASFFATPGSGSLPKSSSLPKSGSTPASERELRELLAPNSGSFDNGAPTSSSREFGSSGNPSSAIPSIPSANGSGNGVRSQLRFSGTPGTASHRGSLDVGSSRRESLNASANLPGSSSLSTPLDFTKTPTAKGKRNCRRELSMGSTNEGDGAAAEGGGENVDLGQMPRFAGGSSGTPNSAMPMDSSPAGTRRDLGGLGCKLDGSTPARTSSRAGSGQEGSAKMLVPETPERPTRRTDTDGADAEGEPRRLSDETTKSPPERGNNAMANAQEGQTHDSIADELMNDSATGHTGDDELENAFPETDASRVTAGGTIRKDSRKRERSGPPPSNLPETQSGESDEKPLQANEDEVNNVLRDISNSNNLTDDDEGNTKIPKKDHGAGRRSGSLDKTPRRQNGEQPQLTKRKTQHQKPLPRVERTVGNMIVCLSGTDEDHEDGELAFELITRLGGEVVSDFDSEQPHCVVTRLDENGEFIGKPGSCAVMGAAAGVSVVGVSWIVECYRRGRWVPVDAHRAKTCASGKGLFRGVCAVLDSAFTRASAKAHVKREAADLRAILSLAGATVVEDGRARSTAAGNGGVRMLVVRDAEGGSRRRRERGNAHVVAGAWVRDAVMRGKLEWPSAAGA